MAPKKKIKRNKYMKQTLSQIPSNKWREEDGSNRKRMSLTEAFPFSLGARSLANRSLSE